MIIGANPDVPKYYKTVLEILSNWAQGVRIILNQSPAESPRSPNEHIKHLRKAA